MSNKIITAQIVSESQRMNVADIGYDGSISAEAVGITAHLASFSNLSFGKGKFGETCTEHYRWLHEFAMSPPRPEQSGQRSTEFTRRTRRT